MLDRLIDRVFVFLFVLLVGVSGIKSGLTASPRGLGKQDVGVAEAMPWLCDQSRLILHSFYHPAVAGYPLLGS